MMDYNEHSYLNVSGIQHYSFCPRQWALIHIEKQWEENIHTVEGNIVHEKAHDTMFREMRGNIIITRSLEIRSSELSVDGICDVVEFHKNKNGITLFGLDDTYLPVPVEYKKGKSKVNDADRLQLCCQAMCLEEMLCCTIKNAYLFYDEVKRREKVELSDELRNKVKELLKDMHNLYERKHTPKAKKSKKCSSCSLKDICLPQISDKLSVKEYMERMLHT